LRCLLLEQIHLCPCRNFLARWPSRFKPLEQLGVRGHELLKEFARALIRERTPVASNLFATSPIFADLGDLRLAAGLEQAQSAPARLSASTTTARRLLTKTATLHFHGYSYAPSVCPTANARRLPLRLTYRRLSAARRHRRRRQRPCSPAPLRSHEF
jgi:hypothetical protein